MATIYSISQSVLKLMEGDPASKKKFAMNEIKNYIIQVVNSLIKSQHLTEEMAGGEAIPDGTILAEYDSVPVEKYKNTARAALPAMPVKLPRNMGIYHVSRTDDIFNGFIPFGAGELQMIGEEPILSDIIGQIGYEPRGGYIYFNKDITTNDVDYRITEVYMLLAVKDLSLYGDFDILPIHSSMELEVIQATYQLLVAQIPPNKKVDVINKQQEGGQ
jgi:hypothetical protein